MPDQQGNTEDESDINRAVSPPEVGYATPTHATSDMRSTTGGGSGVSSMSMDAANSGTSREVVSSATPAPLADPMTIIMKALADLQMQVMEQQREMSRWREESLREPLIIDTKGKTATLFEDVQVVHPEMSTVMPVTTRGRTEEPRVAPTIEPVEQNVVDEEEEAPPPLRLMHGHRGTAEIEDPTRVVVPASIKVMSPPKPILTWAEMSELPDSFSDTDHAESNLSINLPFKKEKLNDEKDPGRGAQNKEPFPPIRPHGAGGARRKGNDPDDDDSSDSSDSSESSDYDNAFPRTAKKTTKPRKQYEVLDYRAMAMTPKMQVRQPVLAKFTEKAIGEFEKAVHNMYTFTNSYIPMGMFLTNEQVETVRINWRKVDDQDSDAFAMFEDTKEKTVLNADNDVIMKVMLFIANPLRGKVSNVLSLLNTETKNYTDRTRWANGLTYFSSFVEGTAKLLTGVWKSLPKANQGHSSPDSPNRTLQSEVITLLLRHYRSYGGKERLFQFTQLCSEFADSRTDNKWKESIHSFYAILRRQVDDERKFIQLYPHLVRDGEVQVATVDHSGTDRYPKRDRTPSKRHSAPADSKTTQRPPRRESKDHGRKAKHGGRANPQSVGAIKDTAETTAASDIGCFRCGKSGAKSGHEGCTRAKPLKPNEKGEACYAKWNATRPSTPHSVATLREVIEILPFATEHEEEENTDYSTNYFAALHEHSTDEENTEQTAKAKPAMDFIPDNTKDMKKPKTVTVQVNNKNVLALLDTGAQGAASWIDESAAKRLGLKIVQTDTKYFYGPLDKDKLIKSTLAVQADLDFLKLRFKCAKVLLRILPKSGTATCRPGHPEITLGNDFVEENGLTKYFSGGEGAQIYTAHPQIARADEDLLIPDLTASSDLSMLSAVLQRPLENGNRGKPVLVSGGKSLLRAEENIKSDPCDYVDPDFPLLEELKDLIREFQDIFVDKLDNSVATGVPLFYVAPHKPFEGVKPRHYSEAKKAYMEDWIPEYLKRGIIKRSNSTTMSPVHVTEKTPGVHDGKFRVTVDASKLNDCMPMIHSMLPTVTERVQAAAGHKYYSAFDMPDSFFQLPADPRMSELYAFSCHLGNFEWCDVLPQGDKNIPGHMSRVMAIVMEGLEKHCSTYIDDVFVYSDTAELHVQHVRSVFERMRKHNLKFRTTKSSAGTIELKALGFLINDEGHKPFNEQVQKFLDAPFPNREQLRSWMGLLNVFRSFLPNVDRIEKAFSQVRKKNSIWTITDEMREAFQEAKRMVSDMPILTFVDENRPLILEVDASHFGTGGILLHEKILDDSTIPPSIAKEPIRMTSHLFTPAALKWPTIEKECFAIVRALQSFENLLLGRSFTLRTDHRNLLYMGHSVNLRVQRWYAYIMRFDITLEHIPGVDNIISDALSRVFRQSFADPPASMGSLTRHNPHFDIGTIAAMEANEDTYHAKRHYPLLCDGLEDVPHDPYPETFNRKDTRYVDRPYIRPLHPTFWDTFCQIGLFGTLPPKEESRDSAPPTALLPAVVVEEIAGFEMAPPLTTEQLHELFLRFHCAATGHLGLNDTIAAIEDVTKTRPLGLRQGVIRQMSACAPCAKMRKDRKNTRFERHSLSGSRPFHTVQVDVLTGMPKAASGNCKIFAVVDTFTRYCVLIPIPDERAETACYAFLQVFGCFGTVSKVISDGGPAFISEGWDQFLQTLDINHHVTQPHLPTSHGIVERLHSKVLDAARKIFLDFSELSEENWDKYIPVVQRIINSSVTVATGYAPATLLFGHQFVRDQKLLMAEPELIPVETPMEQVRLLDDMLALARAEGLLVNEDQILDAYEQTPDTDSSRCFKPGDLVLYRNFLLTTGRLGKLSPRFVGPARIDKCLVDDFYSVHDLVQDQLIYAHARHLIPFNGQGYSEEELRELACSDYLEHTVHKIVSHELSDHPAGMNNPRGNLRFTVAFENDLKGHAGHPGLRWRDLHYVPAFQEYVRSKLPQLAKFLPAINGSNDDSPGPRVAGRVKAKKHLRFGDT